MWVFDKCPLGVAFGSTSHVIKVMFKERMTKQGESGFADWKAWLIKLVKRFGTLDVMVYLSTELAVSRWVF